MDQEQKSEVVVVDDSKLARALLNAALTGLGYEVRLAESVVQALSMIAERAPYLVMTDNQMPGMSGIQLIQVLEQERPDLPVILITGDSDTEEVLAAGAGFILGKPFTRDELKEAIEAVTKLSPIA